MQYILKGKAEIFHPSSSVTPTKINRRERLLQALSTHSTTDLGASSCNGKRNGHTNNEHGKTGEPDPRDEPLPIGMCECVKQKG